MTNYNNMSDQPYGQAGNQGSQSQRQQLYNATNNGGAGRDSVINFAQQFSGLGLGGGQVQPMHLLTAPQLSMPFVPVPHFNTIDASHIYQHGFPSQHGAGHPGMSPFGGYYIRDGVTWAVGHNAAAAGGDGSHMISGGFGYTTPGRFSSQRPGQEVLPASQDTASVPGLDNRRSSYSTNESQPTTPFFGNAAARDAGPHVFDRSTYTTPSPQQAASANLAQQPKDWPVTRNISDNDLMSLLARSPAIPRAIPAVFTPQENMKTLEQSLSNQIPGNRNVYIRGLHPTTDDATLLQYTNRFGPIDTSKAIIDTAQGSCKGFGFAKFKEIRDAERCIRAFYHLGYEVGFARVNDPNIPKSDYIEFVLDNNANSARRNNASSASGNSSDTASGSSPNTASGNGTPASPAFPAGPASPTTPTHRMAITISQVPRAILKKQCFCECNMHARAAVHPDTKFCYCICEIHPPHYADFLPFDQESFNSRLKAEGDDESTNLYISNLPKSVTESDLATVFLDFTIMSSKILRDGLGNSRGVGFARFENRDVCQEVIDTFNGQLMGPESLPMQIRFADTPAQKELKRVTAERRQFRTNEYNVGAYGTALVGIPPNIYGQPTYRTPMMPPLSAARTSTPNTFPQHLRDCSVVKGEVPYGTPCQCYNIMRGH